MQKFIYPGFNDAHCHFVSYGLDLLQYANLDGITDPENIYEKLKEHYRKNGGDWILGQGWDQNLWSAKSFPDNSRLKELFPETPVYLVRVDGHAAWCNDKALKLANIIAQTKVEGGEIILKNGRPAGVLIDNATALVFRLILRS
jgi:predicted amidohydrolase YtcJ